MRDDASEETNVKKSAPRRDGFLTLCTLAAVLATVIAMVRWPELAAATATQLFEWSTRSFGALIQVFVFGCVIACIGLAFSKYGHVRLGDGKPEYGTLSWVFMFICAGMGSSTLYWGVMEWAYYYDSPGLNIPVGSRDALEHSISYSFFHWGLSAWAVYALPSLAMAYHFHVRKNKGLNLASIIEAITGMRASGPVGRAVDLIFLLTMFGALTVSIALTASTFTRGLSSLIGTPDTFTMQVIVIVGVSVLFSASAYIGIDSGMKRLSHMVCWGALLLAAVVFVVGPTLFLGNNIVNGLGLMLQNYVRMSLFTDPAGDGAFTRGWTVFYWLWWVSYSPGVAMFVARVSKGRKIKDVIYALLLGGSVGCWFFFGVLESYAMHQFLSGNIDVPRILKEQGGETAVEMLLSALPAGQLFLAMYLATMLVFLAAHVDAVAYAVAATTTRNLAEGQDPSPTSRVFWCVALTLVPLAMLFTRASLETMKTAVVLTAIPFLFILAIKLFGLARWLLQDFGPVPAHLIESGAPPQPGSVAAQPLERPQEQPANG
ncbi:transporter, betaine/carnitine/choline family [Achromobacter piechaudii ATCC 43553]|uniref:Transporter, betaine/carnitine/choline family n=1 Tax=Achromobacter piechaudii ATCC 43553 TaxID=742159 RepID=D4XEG6_9BURK|nr:transporter, betaine/carnitine/choline family [Achromobacter piechaudii ATCC 43553]